MTYAGGCRIRRVRVPAPRTAARGGRTGRTSRPGAYRLKRALDEVRNEARRGNQNSTPARGAPLPRSAPVARFSSRLLASFFAALADPRQHCPCGRSQILQLVKHPPRSSRRRSNLYFTVSRQFILMRDREASDLRWRRRARIHQQAMARGQRHVRPRSTMDGARRV